MSKPLKITINGKTQNLAAWCRELNLNYDKVKQRINQLKWSIEQALELVPSPIKPQKSIIERIYENVICDIKTHCWNWTGSFTRGNYGQININGKKYRAHRVVYQELCGPIPEDKPYVLHTCDNPKCCNPKHLYTGTQQNNMDDMIKRNRCNPPHGGKDGMSKLTKEQVIKIRASNETNTALAKHFGVSQPTISNIKNRKRWKHI